MADVTPTAPLTAEEAVRAALIFTLQLSNAEIADRLTPLTAAVFIRALAQDGYEAVVRAEADVLRAAIPEDPWVSIVSADDRYVTKVCYACLVDWVFGRAKHFPSCAWLAARAAMRPK